MTYEDYVREVAAKYRVPEQLAFAVIQQESGGVHRKASPSAGQPDVTTSNQGARGFFQLLPSTAYGEFGLDADDPAQNIEAGIRYLAQGLDRNQNDVMDTLAFYHGGPNLKMHGPRTARYVQDVLKRLQGGTPVLQQVRGGTKPTPAIDAKGRLPVWEAARAAQEVGAPPPGGAPSEPTLTPPAVRDETWWDRHPVINELVESLDPHEAAGRRNIAGGIGGLVGGVVGTAVGGPGGAAAFGMTGAGLGGALEQYLFEEGGLGQSAADYATIQGYLPGSTDVAKPPPPFGHTAVDRAINAGAEQAIYEGLGQAVGGAARVAGKRVFQSKVGRTAYNALKSDRKIAIEALQDAIDSTVARKDQVKTGVARDMRDYQDEVAASVKAARDSAEAGRQGARLSIEGRMEAARQAAETAIEKARQQGALGVESATAAGEAAEATARANYPPMDLVGTPPSQAGRLVGQTFAGPGKEALNAAGQEVVRTAEQIPPSPITEVWDEARRILDRLRQRERAFPRTARRDMLPGLNDAAGSGGALPSGVPADVSGTAGVIGSPPPGPRRAWPDTATSKTALWPHVLADARANGYSGSEAELRRLFEAQVAEAQDLIDSTNSARKLHGRKGLLEAIAGYGGIGEDPTFPGEVAHLWEFADGRRKARPRLRTGKPTGPQAPRPSQAQFASLGGVPKVLNKRDGITMDDMVGMLRQDPQFQDIVDGGQLQQAILDAVRAGDVPESTLHDGLDAIDVIPGTKWWEGAAERQAEDEVAGLGGRISAANVGELIKHPAMEVVARILNAGRETPISGIDRHEFKSALQRALSQAGVYEQTPGAKTEAAAITERLAGLLRKSLKGETEAHTAYDAATAHYANLSNLFNEGYASQIKETALLEPGKIVRMIKPDQPGAAQMLVDVLTTQAAAGGDAELGQQALHSLQSAWIHEHLLQGDVSKLGDRLAKLRADPNYNEFAEAFLSTPHAEERMARLDQLAAVFDQVLAENADRIAAAKAAGEAGVESAQAAGKAGVKTARREGARERLAASKFGKSQVEMAEAQGAETIKPQKAKAENLRNEMAQQVRESRRDLRRRQAGTEEEEAFAASTLAPNRLRAEHQVIADFLSAAFRPGTLYGGLSIGRFIRGASDEDMLRWVMKSDSATFQWFINALLGQTGRRVQNAAAATGFKAALPAIGVAPSEIMRRIGEPPPLPPPYEPDPATLKLRLRAQP